MTPAWYELAFGAAYPVVYAHRDADEATRAVTLARTLLGDRPGPWLDLGCGQGRHLARLAGTDRTLVGLDLSAALLIQARREGPDRSLVRADMRRLPLRTGSLVGVMSMFTAFGYFGGVEHHAPVVREVARVLQPGGRWLLDFLNAERVAAELADGPRTRERQAGPLLVRETRHLEDAPRRVLKQVDLRAIDARQADAARRLGVGDQGLTYQEEVTLFTLDELDDLAARAGLDRVDAAGDYAGAPLDAQHSPRWILVYRRDHQGKDTE